MYDEEFPKDTYSSKEPEYIIALEVEIDLNNPKNPIYFPRGFQKSITKKYNFEYFMEQICTMPNSEHWIESKYFKENYPGKIGILNLSYVVLKIVTIGWHFPKDESIATIDSATYSKHFGRLRRHMKDGSVHPTNLSKVLSFAFDADAFTAGNPSAKYGNIHFKICPRHASWGGNFLYLKTAPDEWLAELPDSMTETAKGIDPEIKWPEGTQP